MSNKKIKVIHLLNTNYFSGAENVVITIINSMKNDFEFYYASFEGPIRGKIEAEDINFYPITKMNTFYIKKLVKDLKPDIIHAHDFTTSMVCSLSGLHIPIISHIHNNPPWIRKIGFYSIGYLLSSIKYKKILMVSDSVLNEYIFSNFISRKSEVIGNPIDLSIVIKKSKLELYSKSYDIIFLGRLSEPKNPLGFIEIVGHLIGSNNRIKTAMIGSGEMIGLCKKEIINKNLSDNIKLLGFMDNPYPILSNSKLLLMPSKWEGFGLAAVEALALGVPVIATLIGGLPGIVDNSCGKLCKNNDDMIDEIKKLLQNDLYYSNKKSGALKKAKSIENIKDYCSNMSNLYNRLIKTENFG